MAQMNHVKKCHGESIMYVIISVALVTWFCIYIFHLFVCLLYMLTCLHGDPGLSRSVVFVQTDVAEKRTATTFTSLAKV